jgi:hypothetical protein
MSSALPFGPNIPASVYAAGLFLFMALAVLVRAISNRFPGQRPPIYEEIPFIGGILGFSKSPVQLAQRGYRSLGEVSVHLSSLLIATEICHTYEYRQHYEFFENFYLAFSDLNAACSLAMKNTSCDHEYLSHFSVYQLPCMTGSADVFAPSCHSKICQNFLELWYSCIMLWSQCFERHIMLSWWPWAASTCKYQPHFVRFFSCHV